MPALPIGLLRAGIGLKLEQIKRATQSYVRDRTDQASGTAAAYAVAAGLFAASGAFLIAACFVGAMALFRWVEIHHGPFWAFGAVGALLFAMAAICVGVATAKLRKPSPDFPSLSSRLRVAIKANPLQPSQIDAARKTAAAVLQEPSVPPGLSRRVGQRNAGGSRKMQAGLILVATLLGWAATRRRQQARRAEI